MRELGDTQAQGRTIGNLGNTHYLLGNYKKAMKYHAEVSTCARHVGIVHVGVATCMYVDHVITCYMSLCRDWQ